MNTNVMSYSNMDDIVFERRNKSYGAYLLRRKYTKHVWIAVLICFSVAAFAIGLPEIIKALTPKEEVITAPPRKISIADLAPPPPIQNTPPPPKLNLPPPPTEVIKFLPPKVTEKEVEEEEEMPTIEEVKKAPVIGAENIEGPGDVVFEEPPAEIGTGEEEPANTIFTVVEQMPEFPGGQGELGKYLSRNLRYPESASSRGIEGVVYLSFVVATDGSISDINVMKGIDRDCDAEAVRVVKKMPPWKPGKQSGRAVTVRFSLPIRFKLNQ
jgi:periplasmic protein TonB